MIADGPGGATRRAGRRAARRGGRNRLRPQRLTTPGGPLRHLRFPMSGGGMSTLVHESLADPLTPEPGGRPHKKGDVDRRRTTARPVLWLLSLVTLLPLAWLLYEPFPDWLARLRGGDIGPADIALGVVGGCALGFAAAALGLARAARGSRAQARDAAAALKEQATAQARSERRLQEGDERAWAVLTRIRGYAAF